MMTDSLSTGGWKPGDRVRVKMFDTFCDDIKGTVTARRVALASDQPVYYTVAIDAKQLPGRRGGPLPKTAPGPRKSSSFCSGRLQRGISGDTSSVDVPRELLMEEGAGRLGDCDRFRVRELRC